MDIENYLLRINYEGSLHLDSTTLCRLHRSHMLSVPFENLDIVPLHRPILLSEKALWDKIVIHRRGGFCYELNGLFAWLLNGIGFEVVHLNGRVYNHLNERGRDFDHLTLLIQIPNLSGHWLADVGFGDSFIEPLIFEDSGDQTQGLRSYRLERVNGGMDMLQRDYDGKWQRKYFFDLQPRRFPSDYASTCLYHQTSSQSSFTRGSVISIATTEGRITLDDTHLIVNRNGQREETSIRSEERPSLLQKYFGVII